jgi:hypothetical protein
MPLLEPKRTHRVGIALVVLFLVGVVVLILVNQRDGHAKMTGGESGCNGAVSLCERRLNEVVFPGTHNSFAASEEPGWHFANQRYGIARQLDDGIRALLIDVHFGVYDPARKLVRTDLRAEGSDRNKVAKAVPASALRLADRLAGRVGVGALHGTPEPYLCHTLCELGSEPFDQELNVIARFLESHPKQILMVIVEDYVPPATIEQAFEQTGLLPYVATLDRSAPLPTLGTLIARGHRLVVFAEKDGGSPAWYMPAFSFIQDTPLGARLPRQLSCVRFRGEPDSPILLMNNWIDTFPPQPALNAPIGRAAALRRRIAQCAAERDMQPGILAVDFYQQTNLVRVAEELNARPPADLH